MLQTHPHFYIVIVPLLNILHGWDRFWCMKNNGYLILIVLLIYLIAESQAVLKKLKHMQQLGLNLFWFCSRCLWLVTILQEVAIPRHLGNIIAHCNKLANLFSIKGWQFTNHIILLFIPILARQTTVWSTWISSNMSVTVCKLLINWYWKKENKSGSFWCIIEKIIGQNANERFVYCMPGFRY